MQQDPDWPRLRGALHEARYVHIRLAPFHAFEICALLQAFVNRPPVPYGLFPDITAMAVIREIANELFDEDPYIAEFIYNGWDRTPESIMNELEQVGCKYEDLSDAYKQDMFVNSIALNMAVKKIAKSTGKSEDEVGKAIAQAAVLDSHKWSKEEVNNIINSMSKDVEPIPDDLDS